MSEDDIPEELRDGGETTPDELDTLLNECVERNAPGASILSIGARDSFAALMGNHEQEYVAQVARHIDGVERKGVVIVKAIEQADGWNVEFLQSTL